MGHSFTLKTKKTDRQTIDRMTVGQADWLTEKNCTDRATNRNRQCNKTVEFQATNTAKI